MFQRLRALLKPTPGVPTAPSPRAVEPLPPPWRRLPGLPPTSALFRMAPGEPLLDVFLPWWQSQSDGARHALLDQTRAPAMWRAWLETVTRTAPGEPRPVYYRPDAPMDRLVDPSAPREALAVLVDDLATHGHPSEAWLAAHQGPGEPVATAWEGCTDPWAMVALVRWLKLPTLATAESVLADVDAGRAIPRFAAASIRQAVTLPR